MNIESNDTKSFTSCNTKIKTIDQSSLKASSDWIPEAIVGFSSGLVFSPWSYGLVYYLLFIVSYELIYLYLYRNNNIFNYSGRSIIIIFSLIGFIIGRMLFKVKLL